MPTFEYDNCTLRYEIGDCLELMKEIPDKSIDLVLTDPPYHKIKSVDWDNQHKSLVEYINWIGDIGREIHRLLKDNGSFYIFGDEKIISYVQVELDKYFVLLNSMVWYKRNNISIKWAHNHRSYAPVSERFLFYSKQDRTGLESVMLDTSNFENLRGYFKNLQNYINKSLKEINAILGNRKAEHSFYWGSTQWDLPTNETYADLINHFKINEWDGFREYEDLRAEYEDLRRVFNYQPGIYEVIDIPIINDKENTKHPTTKPLELFDILVKASSNPGDTVLDPFLGSGTTLLACRKTGRNGIGFEINPDYEPIIRKRIMADTKSLFQFGGD